MGVERRIVGRKSTCGMNIVIPFTYSAARTHTDPTLTAIQASVVIVPADWTGVLP